MEKKIRISAVSYLNAKPFVYGLQNSEVSKQTELTLDHPAECARKLITKEADIGLVPVAVIEQIPDAQIISDYCIAANGEVASVLLLSNIPLEKIEFIILDKYSRTSVLLAQILAKFYWNIKPEWLDENSSDLEFFPVESATVIIGDRALNMRDSWKYRYDLAEEWKKFTGLPFVFACWVANRSIEENYLRLFNEALKIGISKRSVFFDSSLNLFYDIEIYLTENIRYVLDEEKRKGMDKFLSFVKQL